MSAGARARRIKRHVANFASPDAKVSERAEHLLIRHYGADSLPFLLPACADANPVVRYRAVWVLGYTKSPDAFDAIRKLCDDEDERVRYDAVLALGVLGDDRAIPVLLEFLALDDPHLPAVDSLSRLAPGLV